MNDFLGQEIAVGDHVVFMRRFYRQLLRGKITKIGKVKVTIAHERSPSGDYQTIQESRQLIKIVGCSNE